MLQLPIDKSQETGQQPIQLYLLGNHNSERKTGKWTRKMAIINTKYNHQQQLHRQLELPSCKFGNSSNKYANNHRYRNSKNASEENTNIQNFSL
jgi:hypothetical protein